jgi:hypothetical protein
MKAGGTIPQAPNCLGTGRKKRLLPHSNKFEFREKLAPSAAGPFPCFEGAAREYGRQETRPERLGFCANRRSTQDGKKGTAAASHVERQSEDLSQSLGEAATFILKVPPHLIEALPSLIVSGFIGPFR